MDFLLEPMELGTELDELLDTSLHPTICCDQGYVCDTGTVELD